MRDRSLENPDRRLYDGRAAHRARRILTSCDIGRAVPADAFVTTRDKCVGSPEILAHFTQLGVRNEEAIGERRGGLQFAAELP